MSLSEDQLQQHCLTIIRSRRIKNKIVVLCEGGDQQLLKQRPSASAYRQLEKFPDANFYIASIPKWWQGGRPELFVCGDKEDVINTYFLLRDMHEENRDDSYLGKDKLFAIRDLDLQPARQLKNYSVSDTEELFNMLYQKNKPHLENFKQHTIFITGLIYKEAYFLVPDLQSLFDHYPAGIVVDGKPLSLESLYQTMAGALDTDENLSKNFQQACARISHLKNLNCSNLSALQQSWSQAFQSANEPEKSQLIYALLTIHQVKTYWKSFKPKDNVPQQRFEEQLTLAIGRFYAQQPRESEHHLPSFFNMLSVNNA